ncbi:MAG: hypothetical protein OMOMHJEC_01701 [Xanthomonadales bacterium]|nr:hypothetical protein [Xanthomonadales bacterium]
MVGCFAHAAHRSLASWRFKREDAEDAEKSRFVLFSASSASSRLNGTGPDYSALYLSWQALQA